MGDATGKRADSHLTWSRSKSSTAPPEPKKLTGAEAEALETKAGPGAGWNSAQTWEEKDISKWSKELLQDTLLPALTLILPSEEAAMPPPPASQEALAAAASDGTLQCQVKVTAVENLVGEASHIVSRGKQRVVFEFTLKLKLEVEVRVAGELHEILVGALSMSDVTNDELQAAKMPSAKCTCEQVGYLPFFEPVVKSFWPTLRTGLSDYVEQVRGGWISCHSHATHEGRACTVSSALASPKPLTRARLRHASCAGQAKMEELRQVSIDAICWRFFPHQVSLYVSMVAKGV